MNSNIVAMPMATHATHDLKYRTHAHPKPMGKGGDGHGHESGRPM